MQPNFSPGSQFLQYRLLEQIGAGGFGMVWSALDEDRNCIVAIKIFFVDQEIQDPIQIQREDQFTALSHPHVLTTYDSGIWNDIRYLVSPYIPGGTLEDRLHNPESLPPQEAMQLAAEIGSALDYLHAAQIIHRDLKPDNILLSTNHHLYLADFDLARVLSNTTQSMHTGRGTPAYSPPEQHNLSAVSPQSDLFSFGIVLFEMFTRQLPWKNEKYLGVQLLSSNEQLPDPCEINPELPAGLAAVLRKMTNANPEQRPASAGQALDMLYACFNMKPIQISNTAELESEGLQATEAPQLLRQGLAELGQNRTGTALGLTDFAVIDINVRAQAAAMKVNELGFMLRQALYYGYQDEFWWNKPTPADRLVIAGQLLKKNFESIARRITDHLEKDREIRAHPLKTPDEMSGALLQVALNTHNDELREKILAVLAIVLRSPMQWQQTAFNSQVDNNLGLLAAQDSPAGKQAAYLIGHLHSESAALAVLKFSNPEQCSQVFNLIWSAAGSLPDNLPLNLRLSITTSWLQRMLTENPGSLFSVFALTFLGASLATGLQTYLTYRLPGFLDLERISIAVECGAFLGLVFGVGILVTRLVAERLSRLAHLARLGLAMLAGGICLNIGLFSFDVLFLKNVPQGPLLSAACLWMALGVAAGNLVSNRTVKMLLSGLAIFTALGGAWWLHTSLATSPTSLSPVFFYDYSWTIAQVLGVILLVSLPVAILGSLSSLSLESAK